MSRDPIYSQSITRTLAEAKDVILRSLGADVIPMLWGASGIGKTEMIEDLISSIDGCRQITLSLGNRDPLDFTGVPSIVDGRTVTNDPDLVPLAGDNLGLDPEGNPYQSVIVYVDELPEGDIPTLKAVYRMLNERMINNSHIHKNVRFVASGNPTSAGARTEKLIPTVANRMLHVEVKSCYKEWIRWATGKGVSPVQRAFIASTPQMLDTYNASSKEDSFATPRTHARLHDFMGEMQFTDDSLLARGAPIMFLGKKAGLALLDFADATDLPDLQSILRDPHGFDIDALQPGSMFLLGQSLVSASSEENIEAVLEVMERMQDNHKAVNFMALTGLPPQQLAGLMRNSVFAGFVAKNKDLLKLVKKAK